MHTRPGQGRYKLPHTSLKDREKTSSQRKANPRSLAAPTCQAAADLAKSKLSTSWLGKQETNTGKRSHPKAQARSESQVAQVYGHNIEVAGLQQSQPPRFGPFPTFQILHPFLPSPWGNGFSRAVEGDFQWGQTFLGRPAAWLEPQRPACLLAQGLAEIP